MYTHTHIHNTRTNKGILRGYDQLINIILDESHERVYSSTHGVDQVVLGLYVIRGDNVYVISVSVSVSL